MDDLVSVIIPTFNRAYRLPTTLASVLAQTHRNWELVLVDDGSTDNTREVVAAVGDERIRYFNQENKGQSAARNHGLDEARGEYIVFLDSDNEFEPTLLEKEVALFAHDAAAHSVIPKGRKFHELYQDGQLIESREAPSYPPDDVANIAKDIFMRTFIFDPTGFCHTAKIRDAGIRFDESMRYMEDWDYVMTIAERFPDGFRYLAEPLYTYHLRYGGDGVVSSKSYATNADTFEYIYQKHKGDRLMEGQTWYPQRVEKWRKIQADFEAGLEPPPHLYYFKD